MVYFCANRKIIQDRLHRKWYFVTKIVLTYCEKKKLKFETEGREFANLSLNRTIYKLEQLEFKLEKIIGI